MARKKRKKAGKNRARPQPAAEAERRSNGAGGGESRLLTGGLLLALAGMVAVVLGVLETFKESILARL